MKKLLVAVMVVAFAATSALAADTIVFPAKNGNVTFNHKMHSEKFECKACHEGTPGKFKIDKTVAHKLCKDCHKEKGVPTKCSSCHKK